MCPVWSGVKGVKGKMTWFPVDLRAFGLRKSPNLVPERVRRANRDKGSKRWKLSWAKEGQWASYAQQPAFCWASFSFAFRGWVFSGFLRKLAPRSRHWGEIRRMRKSFSEMVGSFLTFKYFLSTFFHEFVSSGFGIKKRPKLTLVNICHVF